MDTNKMWKPSTNFLDLIIINIFFIGVLFTFPSNGAFKIIQQHADNTELSSLYTFLNQIVFCLFVEFLK